MRLIAFLSMVFGIAQAVAAEPDPKAPQSPPKPSLTGVKYVDQRIHDPRLKGYSTPEGFKLEIVATEPTIINPVGMTFGADGTLFVIEWVPEKNQDLSASKEVREVVTYQDGSKRDVYSIKKNVKDVVKKLSYDPITGKFNKATVILEDELPSSILIHDGWLYLSGRGNVRRWKLSDIVEGNNKSAKSQMIAKGFCAFHHHQVSGLTIGHDGLLYITSGDDDNVVEGSDGTRATCLRTGGIFRCKPDGSRMELFSQGYRNPYRDLAFDRKFNAFHIDNDNEDGSKFTGCRLVHVAEESDFGWRLRTGARCCQPDPVRGAVAGELPGKLAPMLKTGRGAPAGLLIYNDTGLPEFFRNWLYYPDVFRKSIRVYRTTPTESSFEVSQEFELLKSDDPLFRPCQMVTGPDGAIYIGDWRTDSGGAGRLSGDGVHGRIYRLSWTGGVLPESGEEIAAIPLRGIDSWTKIVASTDAELLKIFSSESLSDRRIAWMEAARRGEKLRGKLLELFADINAGFDARAAALSALESMWNADVRKAVLDIFDQNESDLKRLAVDVLARQATRDDMEVTELLFKMLVDHDRALCRSAALALGRLQVPDAGEAIVANLRTDKGTDPFLTDAYLRALERLGKPGITALLDLGKSGKDADRERCVNIMIAGRSHATFAALPELLNDPHLLPEQRASLISSALNYQVFPPVKWDEIINAIGKIQSPSAIELSAIVTFLAEVERFKGESGTRYAIAALDSDLPETRMAAITAIEKTRFAETIPALIKMVEDRNRDVGERVAALNALRTLNRPSLIDVLKALLKNNPPTELRSAAFRALSSLDAESVVPFATESLESADFAIQTEAVQLLGTTPPGAKMVGKRFLEKKLPRELLPTISAVLRLHAEKDESCKAMLVEVMKGGLLVSLDPAQVEKVRQMVLTRGDAGRGRSLFLNSTTLACVNCHKLEGLGGQVGPDLSRLWDSASIEKIIESLIEPSKEIKEGFQSYRLATTKGKTHAGLKVAETKDDVTIREANGIDIRVPRTEIEELAVSKTSLMPDNVVSHLSFDQFIDLVAFLKNRSAQEAIRGIVTEYAIRGPISPEMKQSDIEQLKPKIVPTSSNGTIRLQNHLPAASEGRVQLEFEVYSPRAQTVSAYVQSDGAFSFIVAGAQVAEIRNPAQTGETDKLRVQLGEGWSFVTIFVDVHSADHRFHLRFQAPDLKFRTGKK